MEDIIKGTAADLADVEVEAVTPPATDAVIERWWEETFVNTGLDVTAWNRIRAAVDRLKGLIAAAR